MKNAFIIFLFTLGITLFYNYVGQLVPQKRVDPPANVEIRPDMTTEEMVLAGKSLVEGKGTCLKCHNSSARFPHLDGIGARAKTEIEGYTDVEYLAESLYDPNSYQPGDYAAGMTAANKPPMGLDDQEILCVIAYLQSLGGEPTVTMDTTFKWQTGSGAAAAPAEEAEEDTGAAEELTGEQLVVNYACGGCHSFTDDTRGLGPGLGTIGDRLNKAELYEALLDPDATMAEGDPPYAPMMMGATLEGNGFYAKVNSKDLKKIVDYLASLKGAE